MAEPKKQKTKVIYVKVPGFNQVKRKVIMVADDEAEGLKDATNYKVRGGERGPY